MCGIAGFYSKKRIFSREDLVNMTTILAHRGPDAEGIFIKDSVGLGHRRLSILDLSQAANQPMVSSNENFVIVFNGEVYNFIEIAKDLNLSLKTSSDTEVILEAFSKLGPSFVEKLNGMFAIAIYDIAKQTLHLFRDRVGVKPLFYFEDGDNFIFASEIKSILTFKSRIKVLSEISHQAIFDFLHIGFVPQPGTIYSHIKKMSPGSYFKVSSDGVEQNWYWKPEDKIKAEKIVDFDIAKQQLKGLLESSLKYRLISDVPFGVFLSGGTDSSVVAAVAQSVSDTPIKTFSIGFKESKFDEAIYSKKIAKHLGTDHTEFYISEQDAMETFEKVLENFDEAFADSSALPTYILSKLARKHVTMVLTGDGGDELFMGYGAYTWAQRLSNPIIGMSHKLISKMLYVHPSNKFKRASKLFGYEDKARLKSHIFSQEQYFFTETEINNLLLNKQQFEFSGQQYFGKYQRKLSAKEDQALFDIKNYLPDDLLVKVDRTTMMNSLEGREPLLDYRIIEFALNLSEDLKVKGGVSKYLLKQVLNDYVPSELFDRPKWGFSIPLAIWLKKDLKFLIDKYLSQACIEQTGLFRYETIKTLKNDFFSGRDFLYNRIFALIVIQKWLLKNRYNSN